MSWWNPFSWGDDDDDLDPDDPNDERNYIGYDTDPGNKFGPPGNLYEYYEPSEWADAIPDDYEPDY